jgi:hypothetical protein
MLQSTLYGWRGYDGLVDISFTCTTGRIIMKINLPEASRHINGLDSPGVLLKVVLQISWTYLSVPLSASFKNT